MEYLAIAAIVLGVLLFLGVMIMSRFSPGGGAQPATEPDPVIAEPAAGTEFEAPPGPATLPMPTGLPLPPAPVELDSQSQPPTFRVVALGLSGAGKTVLLSSLFHSLNHPWPTRPYHLQTGAADAALLANIRARILDTGATWPVSTTIAEGRDFHFDYVSLDNVGRSRTILRMNYLEYAGEILRPGDQQSVANLEVLAAHVEQAHAVIGLIDGFRVRNLLLKEPGADRYFHAELLPMIGFMQKVSCPIQLVITKWDLIEDLDPSVVSNEPHLRRVKSALMGIPQIRALIESGASRRIRIIPVSAVGSDFAKLVDGKEPSVKQPGASLEPINADVPLCAVLPDLLRQVEASLDPPLRRKVAAYVRRRMWKDARAIVALLLHSPAGAVLRGVDGVIVFLEWMGRQTPAKGRPRRSVGDDPELRAVARRPHQAHGAQGRSVRVRVAGFGLLSEAAGDGRRHNGLGVSRRARAPARAPDDPRAELPRPPGHPRAARRRHRLVRRRLAAATGRARGR